MWCRSAEADRRRAEGPALPALLLCLLAALPAHAIEVGLAWQPFTTSYDAEERFDGGALANAERGRLRGQALEATAEDADWRLTLRAARRHGAVAYDGRSQIGFPVATTTQLRGHEERLEGRWWLARGDGWRAGLDGALGQRMLLRDIQPSFFASALTETLRQSTAGVGAALEWRPFEALTLELRAGADRALHTRLDADLHGAGDPARLYPAPRWSPWRELRAAWTLSPRVAIELRASRLDWHPGGSAPVDYRIDGQPTGSTLRYPGSHQVLDELGLGLRLNWR